MSVDSTLGEEGGGGAPRRSLRSAAAPRSRSRSASTWGVRVRVVDDDQFVVGRLAWQENGRTTVYRSRVSFMFRREEEERRGDTPLSVVCEDRIRLTKREELLPGLGLFVHIRVELFAQLQSSKKNAGCKFCMIQDFSRRSGK